MESFQTVRIMSQLRLTDPDSEYYKHAITQKSSHHMASEEYTHCDLYLGWMYCIA